jgi:hypothetical protein
MTILLIIKRDRRARYAAGAAVEASVASGAAALGASTAT